MGPKHNVVFVEKLELGDNRSLQKPSFQVLVGANYSIGRDQTVPI